VPFVEQLVYRGASVKRSHVELGAQRGEASINLAEAQSGQRVGLDLPNLPPWNTRLRGNLRLREPRSPRLIDADLTEASVLHAASLFKGAYPSLIRG